MSIVSINPLSDKKRYSWDDIGNGYLFADTFRGESRYVPEQKEWACYNGKVWKLDVGDLKVAQHAKSLVKNMFQYSFEIEDDDKREKYTKFVNSLNKRTNRDTMLKDAKDVYPMSFVEFDSNKFLFNCQNGILDLKTFEFKPHDPNLLLSKISNVSYNPDAKCERWEIFIKEIMQDDEEKAIFLQKALGYALSGDTSFECFFILYGEKTRNGKGTTMDTISHLLGDYASTAQPETIAQKSVAKGNEATEDVARLKGARFVNVSEPEKGLRLNAALIKQLTGGDLVTARFLHKNSFTYKPEYKLFINTNHLPKVSDNSLFTSGRVKLIPFQRHFKAEEQNRGLKDLFKDPQNLSAILNWCIEGLKLLYAEGLESPTSVIEATNEYREDSDSLQRFIDEHLMICENARTPTTSIYPTYREWAENNGHMPLSSLSLSSELKTRLPWKKFNTGYAILGYILKDDFPKEWKSTK